jgi:hypothetical protein
MIDVVDLDQARRRRAISESFTSLKLSALDRALEDDRLTDLDFRLFYYLCSATDRRTQAARRKQKVMAAALRRTPRAVQICIERLRLFQYITIETKDGGTYANAYRVVLEKANPDSCSENTKANLDSSFGEKRRTVYRKKANGDAQKGEPSFVPILPLKSLEIPSRVRGPSSPDGLGPAGEQIRRIVGVANYRSWFSELAIVSETDDVVTLSAPSRFRRDRLVERFETEILEAWQLVKPTVTRIVVVVKEAA